MTARRDLQATLLDADVDRLGFRPDDAEAFRSFVADLSLRPALTDSVETVINLMRALIGKLDAGNQAIAGVNDPSRPEDGLVALMAMVAVANDVHRELVRRGVPDEIAWKSLSDLGQQVHIHRLVTGDFGMSSQSWCASNYTGRLLWLGRLQFALQKDRDDANRGTGTHVIGVHVPESGPLTPSDIDESLRLASTVALPAFQDYAPQTITLHSWLLDPELNTRLHPSSNIVQFTRRFELYGTSEDAYRDALFFGFHIEPTNRDVDLDSLPQDTSLQRALVAQLKTSGVRLHAGRLKDQPSSREDWPAPRK